MSFPTGVGKRALFDLKRLLPAQAGKMVKTVNLAKVL